MKKTTKKTLSVLLVMVIICALLLPGCQQDKLTLETPATGTDSDPSIVITGDYIAITTTEELMAGATDMTLMDYISSAGPQFFRGCDGDIIIGNHNRRIGIRAGSRGFQCQFVLLTTGQKQGTDGEHHQ